MEQETPKEKYLKQAQLQFEALRELFRIRINREKTPERDLQEATQRLEAHMVETACSLVVTLQALRNACN